jgi:hypothetical protein
MSSLEDKVGILAEEVVRGPNGPHLSIAEIVRDGRVATKRSSLLERFDAIRGEITLSSPETEPEEVGLAAFRRLRDEALPEWSCGLLAIDQDDTVSASGRRIFTELRTQLRAHVFFPEEWEFDLAALYVLQCHVADILPVFFYALIDGTKGAGKTTLLDHLSRLTDSLRLQSFTLATLSRSLTKFRPVSIDEFDITEKNPEMGSATAALVRQGYKRDAAPRLICAQKSNEILALEVAGPKAITFRHDLDDALKDRGFRFPMAAGNDFQLVVRGMAPEFGNLPERLKAWAVEAHRVWTFERVCTRIKEDSFENKVRTLLGRLEATRGAELMTTALLVSEISGIDITESLRGARGARDREAATSRGVEELLDALHVLAGRVGPGLAESEFVVFSQTGVRAEMDRVRNDRRVPPLKDGEFARLRKDALIQDAWRIKLHGYPHWRIPKAFLNERGNGESPDSPESPARQDGGVSRVTRVSPLPPEPVEVDSRAPAEPLSWQEPPVHAGTTDENSTGAQ